MSKGKKSSTASKSRKNSNSSSVQKLRTRKQNYEKTKRMLIASIAILACLCVALFAWLNLRGNANLVPDGQEVHVTFAKGFIGSEYGEVLYDDGVIENKEAFNSEINNRNCVSQLQAGSYVFTGGESISDIVDQLIAGPNSTFTIAEGQSLQDIADEIEDAYGGSVKSSELMTKFTNLDEYKSDYPFLDGHDDMSGFLPAGTYDTQVFGSMEFASSRANMVARQLLDTYVEQSKKS